MIIFEGKYTKAKVMIDQIDKACVAQITQFINHPAFTNQIITMPDIHVGKGCVIGFTMEMPPDKIIPNTVGVDGGCGMQSVNLGKDLCLDLKKVDEMIREAIPFGFEVHENKPLMNMERQFPWKQVSEQNRQFCLAFNRKFNKSMAPTKYTHEWLLHKYDAINMNARRANNSLGTLGGGNHFIEIGESKNNGNLWLTVHTGSRQLGERICRYWQTVPAMMGRKEAEAVFKTELGKIKDTYTTKQDRRKIPGAIKELKEKLGLDRPSKSRELDYIEDTHMEGYLTDMIFAQTYAKVNRQLIINKIIELLDISQPPPPIDTVHNYIDFNDFIIRKGAISSYENQVIIIPFNMEDGLLICKGKSNPDWNYSAPHGAGRAFKRSKAKEMFSSEVAKKRMQDKGIYTSVVPVDEVKEAYKDPKIIEEAIGPTATILDRIRPIINMKEGDKDPKYGKKGGKE